MVDSLLVSYIPLQLDLQLEAYFDLLSLIDNQRNNCQKEKYGLTHDHQNQFINQNE